MKTSLWCSRTFFGTPSYQRANNVYEFFDRYGIRCSLKKMTGREAVRKYHGDRFHIYSRHFLMIQSDFFVVKVHFLDYRRAMEAYQNYYDN